MKKLLIFLIFIFISSCSAGEEFIPVEKITDSKIIYTIQDFKSIKFKEGSKYNIELPGIKSAYYGFIKNTYMDPSRGGDGDALDVLIISESVSQGEKIPIKAVGILKLLDKGQEDHKIIAVPKNSNQTYTNDSIPNSVKNILKTWFCNYKGAGKVEFISWGNKASALEEIKKWSLNK